MMINVQKYLTNIIMILANNLIKNYAII